VKARDFMFKLALLSALIGSCIILVVPFLEWIKHDAAYRVWYSTGLDLMTMKLKYMVLQPFLVFVAGAFGIVGAFAMGKRTNVIGRYIVLAAAVLAVSSFLYWIFSDLYLIYAGGGRTIKMMAPWLLLVGAGCFCFSAALNYVAASKSKGKVGTLKPKRIIILVAIGSLAMLVVPFLNWVSEDYVYGGPTSYSTSYTGLYLMVRGAPYIILPPIGGALGVAGAFALTSSRRRAAAQLILTAGAFAIVSLGWFIVNIYTQGFPIPILEGFRVTVTAESVLFLLAGAGCFMLSARSILLSGTRLRRSRKIKS